MSESRNKISRIYRFVDRLCERVDGGLYNRSVGGCVISDEKVCFLVDVVSRRASYLLFCVVSHHDEQSCQYRLDVEALQCVSKASNPLAQRLCHCLIRPLRVGRRFHVLLQDRPMML